VTPPTSAGGRFLSRDAGPLAAAAGTPGRAAAPVSDPLCQGREPAIDDRPLRAAHALVWSMTDFAVVDALRRLGIRASPMEGGIIGVGAT
jgi:hypothetical protein